MSGSYDFEDDDYGFTPVTTRKFPVRMKLVKYIHPFSNPKEVEKYLNQTKVWVDRDGTDIKIKDIEEDYLFNILSWLHDNDDRIYFTRNIIADLGDSEVFADSLEETPLVKKLRERYKKLVTA